MTILSEQGVQDFIDFTWKEVIKEMHEDFKYCPDCGKQLYNSQTGEFEWLKEVV